MAGQQVPQRFDVIVVGAGPAGSAAAYLLARKGFKVLLLERGRGAGSKELYGGRVYAAPLREVWPELDKEAPIHRWVRKERVSIVDGDRVLTFEYTAARPVSFTAYLTELARWMAKKAEDAGALFVDEVRVDEFVVEDGRVVGVRSGPDRVYADVVVDAEGVNRLLLERLGLVDKLSPKNIALGVKEVLKVGSKAIEERLGLGKGEGLAWVLAGSVTGGLPGGAFIYTFKETVSIGVVVHLGQAIDAIERGKLDSHVYTLVEKLRLHPAFKWIWGDADVSEYGGHLTIEGGLSFMPRKLATHGLVVVGDAAGLLLNTGYTIRGVDFAVYSGKLAAEAIEMAMNSGGPTEENLRLYYEERLKSSFVYRELVRHSGIERVMRDPEFFEKYPRVLSLFASKLFEADYEEPTLFEALVSSAREAGVPLLSMLAKALGVVRRL